MTFKSGQMIKTDHFYGHNKDQINGQSNKNENGIKGNLQELENEYFSSGESGCENSSLQKVRTLKFASEMLIVLID